VKGCGNLRSYPDQLVDAIIFGRELGGDKDDQETEERFEKIRFYLKNGTYPNGADRAEKSRLRSAATHYRLVLAEDGDSEEDKLMLKGKEVISDPHKQYEIARGLHAASHGGINKTTAAIAEKYHWVRIKETVSAAIRNCSECKDSACPKPVQSYASNRRGASASSAPPSASTRSQRQPVPATTNSPTPDSTVGASPLSPRLSQPLLQQQQQQQQQQPQQPLPPQHHQQEHTLQHPAPTAQMGVMQFDPNVSNDYSALQVDPQLMQGLHEWANADHTMQLDDGEFKLADGTPNNPRLRDLLHAQGGDGSGFARNDMQHQRNN
jgi:hypothetical protein